MIANLENFLSGEWVPGDSDELTSLDPSTGDIVGSGSSASPQQLKNAVAQLRGGQVAWEALSLDARLEVLTRFADLVKDRSDELASLVAREIGKPLWEAKTEVAGVAAKLGPTLESLDRRTAAQHRKVGSLDSWTRFRPLGVIGVVGPFNFPLTMVNTHVMPALATGNAVLLKPSEQAPTVAVEYVRLLLEAGVPGDVVALAHGGPAVAETLVDLCDGVCLTGSRRAGAALLSRAGGRTDLMLALEMGGNSPLIVWSYNDVRAALAGVIQSAFVSAGQRCSAARRLIVPIGDDSFVEALVSAAGKIRVGSALDDPAPYFGPLISATAVERLEAVYQGLVAAGAKELLPLKRVPDLATANFVMPAILDVTGLEIDDVEHFGPLLLIERAGSLEEAVHLANSTSYGLAAGIYTTSEEEYQYFAGRIRAGIVNWNQALTGAVGTAPFGGVKDSGNYRPGGSLSVDYCVYAVASLETDRPSAPESLAPGLDF